MSQITEDAYKQLKMTIERKNDSLKKILIILGIFLINGLGFMNAVYASSINSANLYSTGTCGDLLKYKGSIIKISYVQYNHNGANYPAYCMNPNKPGAETKSYDVSLQEESVKDIGLWRTVINGYPYKTKEELGVANKQEAYAATKQAIYCYMYGNSIDDYEGIGEAGARTLRAMKTIINNANNSKETKLSSSISIQEVTNEWLQDKIDSKYVSKTYKVTANAQLNSYQIAITKENGEQIQGIKVTNEQNQEMNQFSSNENFKVLVPIKEMTKEGAFKLTVSGEVKTKPVLYGMAPDSSYQDYALTTASYEDGTGEKIGQYPENETKIIIIKEDEETKERLDNTEFELLDENRNVVYSDLKTDKDGKIEINHLIPGKYYLKETKAKEGYVPYEDLIELQVALHEQYTVTVKNNKEEKPKIEIEKKQKSKTVSASSIKREKLPVTGM